MKLIKFWENSDLNRIEQLLSSWASKNSNLVDYDVIYSLRFNILIIILLINPYALKWS